MRRRRKVKRFYPRSYERKLKGDGENRTRKRILVVAEGESEVSYFRTIKKFRSISNLKIVHSNGSAPKNVIGNAVRICSDSFENDFEQVYCVFDQDTVANYTESIMLLQGLNKERRFRGTEFIAIPSVPCFEYWYLLHMQYTARSYDGYPSPCNELEKELKKFPEFEKYKKPSCTNIFNVLEEKQDIAISNAERSLRAALKDGQSKYHENPSTRIHLVVKALLEHLTS